LHRKI